MVGNSYSYAYGDETGDLGFAFNRGSSQHFAITLLLTNDPNQIQQRIERLRVTLRQSPQAEFKFHKMSNNYRHQFLTAISPLPFVAYTLVMDKARLDVSWQRAKDSALYAHCLIELVKRIPNGYLSDTILTLDQFGSLTATKLAIRRELKKLGRRPFKRIHMKRSRGNELIQCADMIAGSVMRQWQHDDDQFIRLIANKMTVWLYPEK